MKKKRLIKHVVQTLRKTRETSCSISIRRSTLW